MSPRQATYDANTVALMGRVCDEIWSEVAQGRTFATQQAADAIREEIARVVLSAVADGEIDPARLKSMAVAVVTPTGGAS